MFSQESFLTVGPTNTLGSTAFSLWQQGTWPELLLTIEIQAVLKEIKKYQRRALTVAFTPTLFVTVIDFDFENAAYCS